MRIQSWNYLDTVEAGGSIPSAPIIYFLCSQSFTSIHYPILLGYISEQIGQICEIATSQFTDLKCFGRNER